MTQPYEEILEGEVCLRHPPGARHEQICARLHEAVRQSLLGISSTRLLPPRSIIELATGTLVRPDLTLVTNATGRLWLAAEIISPDDHRTDTVRKKELYEEKDLPRLWMIDPRYDNVEIYHGTPYGLTLKGILAQREILEEKALLNLRLSISHLFDIP